jgi:hypothetical protein
VFGVVCSLFRPQTGKKKLFPAKGKAHFTKKGNNEPTAKPDANKFFCLLLSALFCMVLSPFGFAIRFVIF